MIARPKGDVVSTDTDRWYARAHFNLGADYHFKGMIDQAGSEYGQALEIDENEYGSLNNLAAIAFEDGERETAVDLLMRTIRANRRRHLAYLNLAVIHYLDGDYEKAAAEIRSALKRKSNNPQTLYLMALISL